MDNIGGSNDNLEARHHRGASHAHASRQPSRRAEHRPTEIQAINVSGADIGRRQATAGRRDTSQYGDELDAQSRNFQVSCHTVLA